MRKKLIMILQNEDLEELQAETIQLEILEDALGLLYERFKSQHGYAAAYLNCVADDLREEIEAYNEVLNIKRQSCITQK